MTTIPTIKHEQEEMGHLKTLALNAFKSGAYAGMTEAIIFNIMMSARDLGVSPFKALNGGFYIVNGKISMSTTLMADRIRTAGHSIKIPEWTSKSCVVVGQRKDNGDSVKFEFTMEDAQVAGLLGSPTWKKFPKQMLYNRAMSTVARTLFPDVVGNAYSEDEKFDIQGIPAEKRPLEDSLGYVDLSTGEVNITASISEPIEKKYISQDQLENLINLKERLSDDEIWSKFMLHLKIDGIDKMEAKSYESSVKILEKKISDKLKKEMEDAKGA